MTTKKFRVWDKDRKRWGNNFVIDYKGGLFHRIHNQINIRDIENYIIQQNTGVKDTNKQEVFEGDLIEYLFESDGQYSWDSGSWWVNKIFEVVFVNGCFGFTHGHDFHPLYDQPIRKVGNKFDNPELLKQKS